MCLPRFLTQQVDDSVVVTGKEPDKIFKEEDKRRVDNAVIQILGCGFEFYEGVQLIVENRQSLKKLLSAHLSEGAAVLPTWQN